jgi:hypothetical protein
MSLVLKIIISFALVFAGALLMTIYSHYRGPWRGEGHKVFPFMLVLYAVVYVGSILYHHWC